MATLSPAPTLADFRIFAMRLLAAARLLVYRAALEADLGARRMDLQELVGSADDGSDIAPTVAALASPPSRSDAGQVLGDYAQRVISPPGLRTHRTTVLLL